MATTTAASSSDLGSGPRLAGHDHLADDRFFLAGVVVEDAVAGLHLAQVLARERVGDAVPDRGAVADEVVVAVAARFLLQSQKAIGASSG